MAIVKVGGSLAGCPALPDILAAVLAARAEVAEDAAQEAAAGATVPAVVPGGGWWADQVRVVQQRFGLTDRTAHGLALHAMDQFGRLLAGIEPRLTPADDRRTLRDARRRGRVAVWLPARELTAEAGIERSWRVTSDSLAVWLAGSLGVREVILLKAVEALPETIDPDDAGSAAALHTLAAAGVVDEALAGWVERSRVVLRIVPGAQDPERVRHRLRTALHAARTRRS